MNSIKIVALGLMVVGVLALAYGGFSYTSDTHEANVGSLSLSINETRRVNVPVWAGLCALLAGGLIFAIGAKRG